MGGATVASCDCCIFGPVLGNTLRPGGLALTERLAELAGLKENSVVLEIACGKGVSAYFLAQEYNCSIVGIDLSDRMIASCRTNIERGEPTGRVSFLQSDGANLPFRDSAFDAVICECSFSLIPDTKGAAREIIRVLRSGGKLVLSDVILRGEPPQEIPDRLPFARCFASARRLEDYLGLLEQAGFINPYTEDHSQELRRIAFEIGVKFGGIKGLLERSQGGLGRPEEREQIEQSSKACQSLFKEGRPGYAVIAATKP